jgi:hypothetical protein
MIAPPSLVLANYISQVNAVIGDLRNLLQKGWPRYDASGGGSPDDRTQRKDHSHLNRHNRRKSMPLIQLVIVLVVLGVILWAINTYIPMDTTIKKILNVVVVIAAVLYVLAAFGLLGSLSGLRVGG